MYKFIKFFLTVFIVVSFTLSCDKKEEQPPQKAADNEIDLYDIRFDDNTPLVPAGETRRPIGKKEEQPLPKADENEIDANEIDPNEIRFYDNTPLDDPDGTTQSMP